jgi:hypothetical protein
MKATGTSKVDGRAGPCRSDPIAAVQRRSCDPRDPRTALRENPQQINFCASTAGNYDGWANGEPPFSVKPATNGSMLTICISRKTSDTGNIAFT